MAIDANAPRDVLDQIVADPRLSEIERIPRFSPVHVGLTVGGWATFVGASSAYLAGWLTLPIAMLLNAVAIYGAFTPLHDATHRSASSDPFVNDLIGTLSGTLLIPGFTTQVHRLLHLEHHGQVGDPEQERDVPLFDARGPRLVLAQAFPEFVWAHWWITKLWSERSTRERLGYVGSTSIYVAIHVAFLLSPFAWTFVVLWLIPQRLGVTCAVRRVSPIHYRLPHIPSHRYRQVRELADGLRRASSASSPVDDAEDQPFEVELRRSNLTFTVSADGTILDELRREGVYIPTACLQGACGSCKTRVLEGEVDHRDAVLTEPEKTEFVCVCVSRAAGERLVLDC